MARTQKAGWKSSKPAGLSDDFTYVIPGKKNTGGVRGRDYFAGKEGLTKYLDKIDLDQAAKAQDVATPPPAESLKTSACALAATTT
ncbi:hypothetical protein PR001_g23245 [Phytophthora rubi]|uniref:Uncharacterized protein n=1 Tax=Phytophthora rubi TaxID=129364 RepID=A0A6A3IQJ6_9STRA|nr:hypothetical protein PR001_g23245 [Phytophthora rubi]